MRPEKRRSCRGRPAHPRHRAPRVASHRQTSCGGRAGRQGDPGSSASSCRSRTISCAFFGPSASRASWSASAWRRTCHRARPLNRAIEKRAEESRAQLRHPQEPPRVRRRHETAAQGIYACAARCSRAATPPEPLKQRKNRRRRTRKTSGRSAVPTESGSHAQSLVAFARPTLGACATCSRRCRPPRPSRAAARDEHVRSIPRRCRAIYRSTAPTPTTTASSRIARHAASSGDEVASSMPNSASASSISARTFLQSILDEHAPPNIHAGGLGSDALRPPSRSASTFSPRSTRKRARSRAALGSIWAELEKDHRGARDGVLTSRRPLLRALILSRGDRRALDRSPQDDGRAARGHRPARIRQKDPKQEYKKEATSSSGR